MVLSKFRSAAFAWDRAFGASVNVGFRYGGTVGKADQKLWEVASEAREQRRGTGPSQEARIGSTLNLV